MTDLFSVLGFLSLFLIVLYSALVMYQCVILLFHQVKKTQRDSLIPISIIIPFRNERERIVKVISSLDKMNFKNHSVEIIFVDDQSNDKTEEYIFESFSRDYKIINSTETGKKGAIASGIAQASFDLIATLDADVHLHSEWLNEVRTVFSDDTKKMLILPVLIENEKSIAGWFESLDVLALAGTTSAWAVIDNPIICNGANFVFKKSVFNEFRSDAKDKHIASGDDVFFMHQVKSKYPKGVGVLWNEFVIARTSAFNNFSDLLNQRARWTSKSMHYNDRTTSVVAWTVLLTYIMIWGLGVACFFESKALELFLYVFSIKVLIDFFYLIVVAYKFKKITALWFYPLSIFIQLLFVPMVFIKSQLGHFNWKGRRYKK